jgi:hypothetical protein
MSLASGGNTFVRAASWRVSTTPCCAISACRAAKSDSTYQSTSGRIEEPGLQFGVNRLAPACRVLTQVRNDRVLARRAIPARGSCGRGCRGRSSRPLRAIPYQPRGDPCRIHQIAEHHHDMPALAGGFGSGGDERGTRCGRDRHRRRGLHHGCRRRRCDRCRAGAVPSSAMARKSLQSTYGRKCSSHDHKRLFKMDVVL